MKTILYKLEITWWDTHIRLVDESKLVRAVFPHLREIWFQRKNLLKALSWAVLGFPLGVFLVTLKYLG